MAKYSENLIPKMTSNTAPSGVAYASSVYASGYYEAFRAFNRELSTNNNGSPSTGTQLSTKLWLSINEVTRAWISYKFTKPTKVNKYAIQIGSHIIVSGLHDAKTRAPKNWTFEGRIGTGNWIVLNTVTNSIDWEFNEKREFEFNNDVEYDEYRIYVTSVNGGLNIGIDIIEMFEKISSDYFLIKSQNKIYTLFEGGWTDITENIVDINNITEEEYKQYGIDSLENIPVDFLNQLDEFEILSWTTDLEETPKLEFIVSEYKPIMVLHEPEIVTMTNTENPQLHIEGFRDLRPYCESENPDLLILSQSKPNIYTNLIPDPQLILPKGDIQFKMLDKVLSFNMTATEQNKGLIRLIFSIDSGTTWQTYNSNTLEFKQIDIQDLEIVENDGMTVDIFNSIGTKWNEVVQNSKIRFGYYLKIDDMSGVANVDKLEVTIDVLGVWDATLHEVDYDYEYDNEKIYIELYRDGSYKINYI